MTSQCQNSAAPGLARRRNVAGAWAAAIWASGFLTSGAFGTPPAGNSLPRNAAQIAEIERRRDHVEGPAAFENLLRVAGKWHADGGRLTQTSSDQVAARALIGGHDWVDCIVKARVRVDSCSKDPWSGLRLLLRADDGGDSYYAVSLFVPAQEVRIEQKVGATQANDIPRDVLGRPQATRVEEATGTKFEVLKQFDNVAPPFKKEAIAPFKLEKGQTYELTVVADRAAIHCFINGQFVVRATALDFVTHPSGKIGFCAARATGEFSEVYVDSLYGVLHSPFRAYKENPLNIDARSPTVIRDGGLYRMWYDMGGDLGYAESKDGLRWTSTTRLAGFGPDTIKRGQWGDMGKNDAEVLKLDGKYWIFYPANCSRVTVPHDSLWDGMGLQFSPDGIHWTAYEHNPNFYIGPKGSWDELVVGDHSWIKDGDRFKMWYTGINHPVHGYTNQFGYAESLDGIHWKKCRLNPVLKQGAPGDWDGWISCAAVLKLGDEELGSGVYRGRPGSYHLFYTGWPTNNEFVEAVSRIGYAFSLDGIHWVKYCDPGFNEPPYRHSAPILNWTDFGQWGFTGYHSCAVLREGDTVRMWVWGISQKYPRLCRLGLATAKVSDLLAIVEKARRDGLLEQSDRHKIDELMYDAPPPVRKAEK
jgi:hypothetical protein